MSEKSNTTRNDHLPECPVPNAPGMGGTFVNCICNRLRACEERVRLHAQLDREADWREGRAAGLDAARDAVEGTRPPDHDYPDPDRKCDCPYCCDVDRALAAIDALRGEAK